MSGASEATAAMAGHSPFAVTTSAAGNPPPAMSYTPDAAYRPVDSSPPPYQSIPPPPPVMNQAINLNSSDQKRKRGRPRKYAPEGNTGFSMASPQQQQQQQQQPISVSMPQQQAPSFSNAQPHQTEAYMPVDGSASPKVKKSRGRPRGSRNKKQRKEAFGGSSGIGFIPHVLNVNTGEDVSSKIMAICQNGPRAVCVLSANGTISTVTLRQAATSGGTATYEGRFDILSLSGSFMLSEVAGQKSRTGGLSVALAGPDGSVLGGSVAGLLVAASPAQVIVGSFLPDAHREANTGYIQPSSVQPLQQVNPAGGSSSPSRGTMSESSGGAASPLHLSSNNIPQGMSAMPWK